MHCRKDTGSAHAANLFSPNATLYWVTGESLVATFNLPTTRHVRSFCRNCGSALPYAAEGFVVVPAGSLDTTPSKLPEAHLFFASRAEWDCDLAELPTFDTVPPS
ncbi:MAG: GFA family protein [Gloeomargaritaceae cyanobacterium C42_A2020_066]|nr:GFA family protein [Gloeomargaritaceae cyanobacterium C42_A2020_066]